MCNWRILLAARYSIFISSGRAVREALQLLVHFLSENNPFVVMQYINIGILSDVLIEVYTVQPAPFWAV
jgi:hypothetical protein